MDEPVVKHVKERIDECVNMKKQIASMGLLVVDGVAEKLSVNMNAFIKTGSSRKFNIHVPNEGSYLEVTLCATRGIKSGIALIQ